MHKVEIYRINEDGIPQDLRKKFDFPNYINSEGHPLVDYVKPNLINSDLDLILLKGLNQFYQKLAGEAFNSCRGVYVAKNHTWMRQEIYQKLNEAIKKEYGVETERAIILPMERVDYWSTVHEMLHDVFNKNLSSDQRESLLNAAAREYNSSKKLGRMLEITHLNRTSFEWNRDEIGRIRDNNEKEGRSPLSGFDNFYKFGSLNTAEQFQLVDEFISNFYANDRGFNRWSDGRLMPEFKKTMQEIGYNLKNPPEVQFK